VGSQWQGRKRKIKDEQWAWGAGLFAFEWGGGLNYSASEPLPDHFLTTQTTAFAPPRETLTDVV